jgi:hypothetical protein
LNIGAQIRYDISPKITAVLNVANLYTTCFGGSSTPWSKAFPPNRYTCEYDNFYTTSWTGTIPGEGFFYGASPNDPANGTAGFPPEMQYPYQPIFAPNAGSTALPFQVYLEFLIKL